MARGWESKSVESQQDAAPAAGSGERLTAEQRRLRLKRESVELSRRRVLHEIQETRSAVRRASLEAALAFLDQEIAELDSREKNP